MTRRGVRALVVGAVVAVAATCLSGCSNGSPTPGPSTAALNPSNRIWFDGFSGAAGSSPSASKWGHDIGGGGYGNDELEYYTAGSENGALDGHGDLAITARSSSDPAVQCWYGTCRYTSSRLLTSKKFSVKYGRIEARIRVPAGQGMWPAFWMLGQDIATDPWPGAGEIDVMENVGKEPSTVHGTVHGPGYSGADALTSSYTLPDGAAFSAAFHVFSVDWTPDSITFAVDGHAYETQTPETTRGNPWVFDHPFFLLLDLAVGGSLPGDPDQATVLPATMLVDYVAVYRDRS